MSRGVPLVAMSLTLAAATSPCAERHDLTAEDVIARVEAAEKEIRDVRLKFVQRTALRGTGETQEMMGSLALLKSPDRFDVRFTAPVEQRVHYDGRDLVVFFVETAQAFRQKAKPEDLAGILGLNPADAVGSFRKGYRAALLGCERDECRISFKPENPADGGGSPRAAIHGAEWTVTVDRETWRLKVASFTTGDVEVSLRCHDYRVNGGLTTKDFVFKLPEGVEVHEGLPLLFGGRRAR